MLVISLPGKIHCREYNFYDRYFLDRINVTVIVVISKIYSFCSNNTVTFSIMIVLLLLLLLLLLLVLILLTTSMVYGTRSFKAASVKAAQ